MSAIAIDASRVRAIAGAWPGVAICTADGRWVTLHSTRNPRAEARAWVDRHLETVPRTVIVIGAGLGYVVDEILARHGDARVIVLEPEPAFAARLADRFTSGRVSVLTGPDYAGAADAWTLIEADDTPPVLVHPVVARAWAADVERAKTVADRLIFNARANGDARRANAGPYLLNTLRNVSAIAAGGDVDALANLFTDRPAVVAAAGPSLTRNLDDLRAVRDRVVLIAVDTAARPLLTAGIAPDLIVGLDPTDANARHFVGLPSAPGSFLVGEGSLDVAARQAFAGRSFTFKVSNHEPWPWLASLGLDCGRLRAWGSVVTSAFDLALRMGCPEIGFVGLDLAFTGQRPYCRDMTWEGEWAKLAAWGHSLDDVWAQALDKWKAYTTVGVNGRQVTTAPHLVAFRDWLVEQIAEDTTRPYINATGGGILSGSHLQASTLEHAFAGWSARDAAERRQRIGDALSRSCGARQSGKGHRATFSVESGDRDRWRAFAFDTVTDAQIDSALSRGASGPCDAPRAALQPSQTNLVPHASRLPVIRPSEAAAVIRALLGGGNVPAWVTRDGVWPAPTPQEAAAWIERARDLLRSVLSNDAPLRPDVDLDQLQGALEVAYLGVPASALFPWTSEVGPLVQAFEAALASAIDVTRTVRPGEFPDRREHVRAKANTTSLRELARIACEWELSRTIDRL